MVKLKLITGCYFGKNQYELQRSIRKAIEVELSDMDASYRQVQSSLQGADSNRIAVEIENMRH